MLYKPYRPDKACTAFATLVKVHKSFIILHPNDSSIDKCTGNYDEGRVVS